MTMAIVDLIYRVFRGVVGMEKIKASNHRNRWFERRHAVLARSAQREQEIGRPPSQGRCCGVRRALPGLQMSAQGRRFILAPKHAHSLQLRHDRADKIRKRVREECR
jgi:hypothetical protein